MKNKCSHSSCNFDFFDVCVYEQILLQLSIVSLHQLVLYGLRTMHNGPQSTFKRKTSPFSNGIRCSRIHETGIIQRFVKHSTAKYLCISVPILWVPILWVPTLWVPILWVPILWVPIQILSMSTYRYRYYEYLYYSIGTHSTYTILPTIWVPIQHLYL